MQASQVQEKLQTSLLKTGDYFEIGWLEFTKNIRTFVLYLFIIDLPIALIDTFSPASINPETGEFEGNFGIAILLRAITLVLATLTCLAAYKIVERSINGQNLEAMTAMKSSTSQMFIMLLVSIIASILVGFGFIFLIIPGIWLGVNWTFISQAIALRGCKINAMSYSKSLVKNRWWALFGRLILLTLCLLLLFVPILLVVGFIAGIFSIAGFEAITQVVSSLIVSLVIYYVITINTVIFLNFDYTKEGV